MGLNPRPEKPTAPSPASAAVDKMENPPRPPKPLSSWLVATADRSDPLIAMTTSSWTPAAIMERIEQKAKMGRSVASCPPTTTNDVAPEIPPISWPSSMDELDFAARFEMHEQNFDSPVSPLSPATPWPEAPETATVVEMVKTKASGKRPIEPNTPGPPGGILDKLVTDLNHNPDNQSFPWPQPRVAHRVDSTQALNRLPSTSSHNTEPTFTIERPRSSTSHKSEKRYTIGRPPSTASHKTDPSSVGERRPSIRSVDSHTNGKKPLSSRPSTMTLLDKTDSRVATPERQPSTWLLPGAVPKLESNVNTPDKQPAAWLPPGAPLKLESIRAPEKQRTSWLPPATLQKIDSKDLLSQPTPPPNKPLPVIPPMSKPSVPSLVPAPAPAIATATAISYLRPSGLEDLKIIGVEEHIAIPHLTGRFPDDPQTRLAKEHTAKTLAYFPYSSTRLADVSDQRIKDMDDNGIAFQIISRHAVVNPLNMDVGAGTALTRQLNDELKWAVDENPKRFAALAELPFQAPDLAIRELRRCILRLGFVGIMLHGTIGGKFLDDPMFDDLLSSFEELDVPLFLHPGVAPRSVVDTYYTFDGKLDLFPDLSAMLAGPGFGWHNEVALHVLRLAISGTLDRHPKLKLVIGHQGETLPMLLQRFDAIFQPMLFGLERTISDMLRKQVWIAISGFFSVPVTMLTIQTWGVDKVLFANGYPLVEAQKVPDFVRRLGEVVAPEDLRKICQTNAERLFKFRADDCGRTRSNRKWTMIL